MKNQLKHVLISLCSMVLWASSIGQTMDQGAMVRSNSDKPVIYLIFTGDEFADGAEYIRKILRKNKVKAHFFLTGNFYRNEEFSALITALRRDGHYLGAHSNRHLLYVSWSKRDSTLVTEEEYKDDVVGNYAEMERFGILREDAPFFLPAYEWYNEQIAQWTNELGLSLINHSTGTRSAADYTMPAMGTRYVDSESIYKSILEYESDKGLKGFHLLLHIGTDPGRTDKFYYKLGDLIQELKRRGYQFALLKV